MSRGFYNYDTRGASASDQIMTLERLLEEANCRIEDLEWENKGIEEWREFAILALTKVKELNAEVSRLHEIMNTAETVIRQQREERLALRGMLAAWVDPAVDGIGREELIKQTLAMIGD